MKNTNRKIRFSVDKKSNACINFERHAWTDTGDHQKFGVSAESPLRGYDYQYDFDMAIGYSTLRQSDLDHIFRQAKRGKRLDPSHIYHFTDDYGNALRALLEMGNICEMEIEDVALLIFMHTTRLNYRIVRELWIYGLRRGMDKQELTQCLKSLGVEEYLFQDVIDSLDLTIKEAYKVFLKRKLQEQLAPKQQSSKMRKI